MGMKSLNAGKPKTELNTAGSQLNKEIRKFLGGALLTMFTVMFLVVYLSPFGYMGVTSLKDLEQFSKVGAPILPSTERTFAYEGKNYPLYYVPIDDELKEWALVGKGRESSSFVDPNNPDVGLIEWEGRWRTLDPVWELDPRWENYEKAWTVINFPRLLFNTVAIAVIGIVGTLISCIAVAYGFSRFRIPGKRILFLMLIATIILPRQVTLVPTYTAFVRIGWVGTWLPLIVPHFFANAYNTFLLRQYFMSIPREMDEAAMIDGASPLRTLISVIIPQSKPAIAAVTIFHMVFAWNDYFEPFLYLANKPDLQPISVGIHTFNALYSAQPHLIQAVSLMSVVIPLVIFFFTQRYFMQGIVVTGVDK